MTKIIGYHVAWYNMERDGSCFDESFYPPEKINEVINHVETVENENWCDRTRVFVRMDNGDEYELKLEKLDKNKRYSNFYD